MGRFLIFLVVVVALIGVVGWHQGWLQFSKTDAGEKTNINVSVDKEKAREEVNKVKESVGKAGSQVKEKVSTTSSDSDK